ncbi:MAG: hypothetical protein HOP02_01360 [Methylococcaceae bacterium]|nr:hypothetical protein [Methylococcaceae bacterium]
MTVYVGKPEAETLNGSSGDDIFENILGADNLLGGNGSDTFKFLQAPVQGAKIDGGTDNGTSDTAVTPGTSTTTGSTLSAVVNYTQTDMLSIESAMDLSELSFTHIEKIILKDGVNLTMSAEQFEAATNSLEYTSGTTKLNPGLQVEGTVGGSVEKLTIKVDSGADFQLDDATTGYLFKELEVTIEFTDGNVRYDGTAAAEIIQGGSGTEYITPRLGNDIIHAGAGNDLLIGHEGADQLYGEAGDDIFLITRIATKAGGGTFAIAKASDGNAELVAGDIMDGGTGIDELRITAAGTAVSATENTITLTEDNFRNIEKVTLGTTIAKDAQFAAVQDQMAAGAYTAVTTGKDAINVDGSALKAGVTYQGNDGDNKLLGGSGNDTFIGAKGNDTLDGGNGTDTMVLDPDALASLKVFLGKDQHTFLTNASGEHDTFNSIEKVEISGQSIDIGFLAQPAANLQNIGVLSTLLFNQGPGIDALSSLAANAGDAKGLVNNVMSLGVVKSAFDGMSNAQFASTLVNNGLGIADQGAIGFATDYLNTHSRAELVLVGIQYEPIVAHAFGADGLALI